MKSQLEIHLHTNYTCNLKCKHCYNESGGYNHSVMPFNKIIQLISFLCAEYDAEIHLEGGEIFLLPQLLGKMNMLPKEVLKRITITTNGTICLKDQEIISLFTKIGALRISVEGHTNEQQAIRGVDLDKVLDTAMFYQKQNVPVWLRVTLNKYNVSSFVEKTLPELQGRGFQNIQVYEFQKVGRGNKYSNLFALDDSIGAFLNDLVDYSDNLTGNIRIMFSKRRVEEILAYKKLLNSRNYQVQILEPENGISIHADGDVYLCAWDNDKNNSFANVLNMEMQELADILNQRKLVHDCEHCSAIQIVK